MKQYSKLCLLAMTLLLTACASTNKHRAEAIQVNVPTTQANLVIITPAITVAYESALALLKQDELVQAQQAFETLAKEAPGIAGVHLNLALIHYQQKRFLQARQQVDKVINVSPQNAVAYNLSGTLYRNQGKFKEARLAYAKALKVKPGYPQAHLNMAILFDIYLQYWEDAKIHYERYLELSSEDESQVKLWLQDVNIRLSTG